MIRYSPPSAGSSWTTRAGLPASIGPNRRVTSVPSRDATRFTARRAARTGPSGAKLVEHDGTAAGPQRRHRRVQARAPIRDDRQHQVQHGRVEGPWVLAEELHRVGLNQLDVPPRHGQPRPGPRQHLRADVDTGRGHAARKQRQVKPGPHAGQDNPLARAQAQQLQRATPGGSRRPAEHLVVDRRPPPVHGEVARGSPDWHTSSPARPRDRR